MIVLSWLQKTGHYKLYNISAAEFAGQLEKLRVLVESELRTMEKEMDATGARTPHRIPVWFER